MKKQGVWEILPEALLSNLEYVLPLVIFRLFLFPLPSAFCCCRPPCRFMLNLLGRKKGIEAIIRSVPCVQLLAGAAIVAPAASKQSLSPSLSTLSLSLSLFTHVLHRNRNNNKNTILGVPVQRQHTKTRHVVVCCQVLLIAHRQRSMRACRMPPWLLGRRS